MKLRARTGAFHPSAFENCSLYCVGISKAATSLVAYLDEVLSAADTPSLAPRKCTEAIMPQSPKPNPNRSNRKELNSPGNASKTDRTSSKKPSGSRQSTNPATANALPTSSLPSQGPNSGQRLRVDVPPNIPKSRTTQSSKLESILFSSPHLWANKHSNQAIIADKVLSRSKVMKKRNFQAVARQDLELMAHQYDQLFFQGILLPLAESYGLSFRLSSRMTRAGGKTTRTVYPPSLGKPSRTHYEIALSTSLLFQSFRDTGDTIRVCGYDCPDRLTAMQRIVEHELIHLCEMLVWIQSDCAAKRFQSIAHSMFGHTEHKHELTTQHERALKDYNIRAGSKVAFQFEGKTLVGIVNRITRRATILVEDSNGQRFSNGRRYLKYYVPIQQLRPFH